MFTATISSAAQRRALVLLATTLCAVLTSGCAWDSWVPKGRPTHIPETARAPVVRLTLGETHEAELNCKASDCNQWYAVEAPANGRLDVRVVLDEPRPDRPLLRVVLKSVGTSTVLAQAFSDEGDPVDIGADVTPRAYGILVQGSGAVLPYDITATFTRARASPAE